MATAQSHLSRFRTRRRHCHLTIPLLTWPNFQSYTSVFHRFLKSTVSILNKVLLYVDVARFRKQSSYSLSASLLPHDLRNPSLLSNLSLPPYPSSCLLPTTSFPTTSPLPSRMTNSFAHWSSEDKSQRHRLHRERRGHWIWWLEAHAP